MTEAAIPWYVRGTIAVGAWVTAVVLMLLGGVFLFGLLDIEEILAASFLGAAYLAFGISLLRAVSAGVFREQLGIATAAAGAALIAGGIAGEFEEMWAGFAAAVCTLALVVRFSAERILQFLVAALAAGLYVAALIVGKTAYFVDLVALATPAGLALLLFPPRRDLAPTAVALLLTFPFVSVFAMESGYWLRNVHEGGTIARSLHIVLFLALVTLHWRRSADDRAKWQTAGFGVVATAVCLLLPPGGSAAMLLLMLAFVIGSAPFAALGAALEVQFLGRYYYSLEMSLLNKSLLLMAVGFLLTGAWWLMVRGEANGEQP